ncbi:MAG TPA: hypothetical protein PLZ77_05735 [Lachnospiraceae bacterium]|nr:hypothetical protein [Lachnospiraceae bacterium]HPF29594.1 hypothetical protein [Lachnospiraceae bacterium]
MADHLDRINHENYLRGNLIKWWNVNIIPAQTTMEEDAEDSDYEDVRDQMSNSAWSNEQLSDNTEEQSEWNADSLMEEQRNTDDQDDDKQNVIEQVLQSNSNQSVYEIALKNLQLEEAKEIYERLLREAKADEEKKQKEIENAMKNA